MWLIIFVGIIYIPNIVWDILCCVRIAKVNDVHATLVAASFGFFNFLVRLPMWMATQTSERTHSAERSFAFRASSEHSVLSLSLL